jgi:hypothetical protein
MTATLIFVLFALLALGIFLVRVPGSVRNRGDESPQLKPVDLDAFRNLVDPAEEQFLRTNLPAAEFRTIQRQRMRAAVDYVAGVSYNSAVLLRLGLAARRSPEPQVAEAGRRLMDNALRLRVFSLLATGKLYARIAWPGATWEPAGIMNHYQEMNDWAALLSRLQRPENTALVSRAV